MTSVTIDIVPFDPQYATHFHELNVAWLKKYFYVEPYDEKILSHPETHILKSGGFIFFAKSNAAILGTVALINQDNFFELSKMAVTPAYQGEKNRNTTLGALHSVCEKTTMEKYYPLFSQIFGCSDIPLQKNRV